MTESAASPPRSRPLPLWKAVWKLVTFSPGYYLASILLRSIIFGLVVAGVATLNRAYFNSLTGKTEFGWNPYTLAALMLGVALVRAAAIILDITAAYTFFFRSGALLRKNLIEQILRRPGGQAIPGSAGDAISRFRDDVDEVVRFVSELPFSIGSTTMIVIAFIQMVGINAQITFVLFVPLVVIVFMASRFIGRVETLHAANRQAAGSITDFIGEIFGAVQAVKIADAASRLAARFRALSEIRRKAAVRDRLFSEFFQALLSNVVSLGTGAVMILAAQSLRTGQFTLGDLVLFITYMGNVANFVLQVGFNIAAYKMGRVALQRLQTLMTDALSGELVQHGPVYMRGDLPLVPFPEKHPSDRLEVLDAHNLTYRYPENGRGIAGINLSLRRGSFTVITGRIGSGKSTLLRVLLGLLPMQEGEIFWNGEIVRDPAAAFVPPRCAYTAQVPSLFSESLRDNILLGLPEDKVDLSGAIYQAVLEADLNSLDQGLDTLIGPKGVKISGGQRQRAAAARMFVRNPELLVFDDLSSALDVETETQLWERVFARQGATCLVVSHRRPALRRADHILVLKEGQLVAEGLLDELLVTCEEMQHLWTRDANNDPGFQPRVK